MRKSFRYYPMGGDRKMKISKSIRYLTSWIKILKSKRPCGEKENKRYWIGSKDVAYPSNIK